MSPPAKAFLALFCVVLAGLLGLSLKGDAYGSAKNAAPAATPALEPEPEPKPQPKPEGGGGGVAPLRFARTAASHNTSKAVFAGEVAKLYPEFSEGKLFSGQVKLLRLFNVVLSFFEDLGVEYWLDYGTLLASIRDFRLFPKDHDVDFSVRYSGWDAIVANKRRLKEFGCGWTDNSHRHHGRRKAVITCKWFHRSKKEGADVYGWAEEGDKLLPPTREMCRKGVDDMDKPCGVCPVPAAWIFPANCSASFHGRAVCLPAKPETHLVRLYGTMEKGAKCDKRRCCVSRHTSQPPMM